MVTIRGSHHRLKTRTSVSDDANGIRTALTIHIDTHLPSSSPHDRSTPPPAPAKPWLQGTIPGLRPNRTGLCLHWAVPGHGNGHRSEIAVQPRLGILAGGGRVLWSRATGVLGRAVSGVSEGVGGC